MKLSILDQSPISSGKTPKDALETSIKLAQLGDKLGFERFWIAEHHDLFGLSSSNPAVMIGIIGQVTGRIKIGAGAVLLPYYKPFHVAETYNLLATLYPERIDLGLGRAPGGSAQVSMALSDNYLQQVGQFPSDIDKLQNFLHNSFPKDADFAKISPTPVPLVPPKLWLLGTSEKSAKLAVGKGLLYAFGHFMAETNGPNIVKSYRKNFEKQHNRTGYVIVAVHVICAETTDRAYDIARSTQLWSILQNDPTEERTIPSIEKAKNYPYTDEQLEKIQSMEEKMVIGNPQEVTQKLKEIQNRYKADELMVVTITHDEQDKLDSYELIAKQFL